ncbi:hypothetical protein Syun_006417 [Stephania yunnanensis]|uniref:Helicase ATP-binding domain-containing protein n=1 Tax=Stephania yunnanensis TaxID=152371 RepID=A0AAP0Q1C0_9MAGN
MAARVRRWICESEGGDGGGSERERVVRLWERKRVVRTGLCGSGRDKQWPQADLDFALFKKGESSSKDRRGERACKVVVMMPDVGKVELPYCLRPMKEQTLNQKFDVVTRYRIKDGGLSFFSDIGLLLIDEVHLLNDQRGASLEAIVNNLKCLQEILK